ncbi:MAG: response regulator transcription factor [Planctomycetota bacterium]|jgi:DNA-binding response OmpR family regulator
MTTDLKDKNVLLVDDDPDMLTALETIFADTGAVVEKAADGNAAIESAESFDPDLVVLDAMLPKRSGFLVLEKLRATGKKHGERPFVIMITGNEGKRHQALAERLGVDGYLTKPFRMERLMEKVEVLFGE